MFSSGDTSTRNAPTGMVGVTPLRLGTALVLLQQHVWPHLPPAFQALWNGKSWDMIDLFSKAGLPWPKYLAVATAVIAALVCLCWLLGFLTRLSAVMFMPVALGAVMVCKSAGNADGTELSLLYFLIAISVAVCGPGWFSLDALFRRRRGSRTSGKLRITL